METMIEFLENSIKFYGAIGGQDKMFDAIKLLKFIKLLEICNTVLHNRHMSNIIDSQLT